MRLDDPYQLPTGAYVEAVSIKKSEKIYACVVDVSGEQRSLTWRFMTNKSDVYGGAYMSDQKLSLHGSGVCRWANLKKPEDGSDRAFMKWYRPPTSENVSVPFRVIFPYRYLRSAAPIERNTDLSLRLPMPPEGGATELAIGFTSLAPDALTIPPSLAERYIAARLADGTWIYLVPQIIERFSHPQLNNPMNLSVDYRQSNRSKVDGPTQVTMQLFCGTDSNGGASVIEMSNLVLTPTAR